MKQLLAFSFFAIFLTFSACKPKVYTAPNTAAATAAHNIIAILPPMVSIKGRKKDDPEAIKRAAEADVYTFQQEMYSWMLRRKQQGKIRGLEIMDPETTNAKFKKAGFSSEDRSMTPAELANVLGVDAVITSNFNTTKPMSQGAAIAAKEKVIAAKLPKLMENEAFRSEMEAWVGKLKAAGISGKSIVSGADVDVVGNIHVGDTNADADQSRKHKRENILENSKIKVGDNFRLGNDYK